MYNEFLVLECPGNWQTIHLSVLPRNLHSLRTEYLGQKCRISFCPSFICKRTTFFSINIINLNFFNETSSYENDYFNLNKMDVFNKDLIVECVNDRNEDIMQGRGWKGGCRCRHYFVSLFGFNTLKLQETLTPVTKVPEHLSPKGISTPSHLRAQDQIRANKFLYIK